jgi:hypothetical protein
VLDRCAREAEDVRARHRSALRRRCPHVVDDDVDGCGTDARHALEVLGDRLLGRLADRRDVDAPDEADVYLEGNTRIAACHAHRLAVEQRALGEPGHPFDAARGIGRIRSEDVVGDDGMAFDEIDSRGRSAPRWMR